MSSHPVIIVGNGPSAKSLDLPRVGTPTIGMSGAYGDWRAINFRPTYYVCLNTEEGPSHAEAIDQLVQENRVRRFLLRDNVCSLVSKSPRIVNYDELRAANPFFAVDPVSTDSHALLFAIALGYRLVGIAGVDRYHPEAPLECSAAAAEEATSSQAPPVAAHLAQKAESPSGAPTNSDLDHAQIRLKLQAWEAVRGVAAASGVRVFNISFDSHFDQFPYLSLEDFRSLGLRMLA